MAIQSKTSQELFDENEHLTTATLYKMLGQPHSVAQSKSLEYDDLLQSARIGLWLACGKYNGSSSRFETYAINYIRWEVKNCLNRHTSTFKYNPNNKPDEEDMYGLVGYDSPVNPNTHLTVSDVVNSSTDVEDEVINSFTVSELLSLLNEREKTIVIHRANGKTNVEIAELLGVTPQAISSSVGRIRKKLEKEVL